MVDLRNTAVRSAVDFIWNKFGPPCRNNLAGTIEKEFNCCFVYKNGDGCLEFNDKKYETQFLLRFT